MNKVAKFSKVPFEQFLIDFRNIFDTANERTVFYELSDEQIKNIYDSIQLPTRATKGSCGYDFKSPFEFVLNRGKTIVIPTGISCELAYGWGLFLFPRSGHGFKYRIQLDNTVGVIDSDYFESSNHGHIMIKLSCDSFDFRKHLDIKSGDGFAQGVILPYGLTVDDNSNIQRDGGFGSTDVDTSVNLCDECINRNDGCNADKEDYSIGKHNNVYGCAKFRQLRK